MYLFCYGTRPEIIKQFPLIKEFKKRKIKYKTLFTGQHLDLVKDFYNLIGKPNYTLEDVLESGQSLNQLVSKIISKTDIFLKQNINLIVQGDTSTAFAVALAGFQNSNKVIHLEAGLRTFNLKSPFPEEANRSLISKISDIHFCPTRKAVANLKAEGIKQNVFYVGNTIVDSYKYIDKYGVPSEEVKNIVDKNVQYFICTLHRRENRKHLLKLWKDINAISEHKKIIYINHPSVNESAKYLSNNVLQINPVSYQDMVYLIKNSDGVISDSGGIQEEVISAKKNILICRDTTERPETIDSGYGKLVGLEIANNISFLENKNHKSKNPYGENVSQKITDILCDLNV